MIVIPAIDIKEGKVVRLFQGKFDQVTAYNDDPITVAKEWEDAGAKWIHVVDLDGALTGKIQNLDIILKIAKAVNVPIQMGGGIRDQEEIKTLLNGGVARVILGTKVVTDLDFLQKALKVWDDKIAVSLDCAKGIVLQKGWTAPSHLNAVHFAQQLEDQQLKYLIYTDTARDGTLSGPNFEGIEELFRATATLNIVASGGISSLDDLKRLRDLKRPRLAGVIVGKALYEKKFNLKEALELCSTNE